MKSYLTVLILSLAAFTQVYSQAKPWITDVDFRIENEKVVVTYSILNYLPGQLFNIRLTFQTPESRIIIPVSVSGDVTGNVTELCKCNFHGEGVRTSIPA